MATAQQEPALGRRDLKKLQTREALIAAALRLAAERGLDRVTVDDIAAEVGVSARTFFNYFATKDDAVLGDHDVDHGAMRRRLAELLPQVGVLEAIHRSMFMIIAALEAERDRWFLRMEVVAKNPLLLSRLVVTGAAAEKELAAVIADHLGVEQDGYPTLVVAVTGAAVRSAMARWAAAGGTLSLGGLVDEAFRALAAGLPEPTPRD
ncbi:MAG: TetR family transcriptional regulator [Hamadaea sp.]|nr:TetR family transcriptional regulator [Hamadaea sp.]